MFAIVHSPADMRVYALVLASMSSVACGSDATPSASTSEADGDTGADASADSADDAPATTVGEATSAGDATTNVDASTDATTTASATDESSGGEPVCARIDSWCTRPDERGGCRYELEVPGGGRLYYWANRPLPDEGECDGDIERAVLVQHGNGRTAWSYAATMIEATELADVAEHTLVVAPWFPADEDAPPPDFHRWDPGNSGWKSGDASTTEPPVSSFTVVDHILVRIGDPATFPALADIVVTGHSAGGQFVQRHAIASDIDDATSVPMRWIVANPSSYLYLDDQRWDGEGAPPDIAFALPSGTDCDDSYDDFKYGLSEIPPDHYVAAHLGSIPDAYLARDVRLLLGEDDVLQDEDLDTSCPAVLQGEHRRERGLVFAAYLDARFPGHAHGHLVVPGVGHSAGAMYRSPEALAILFP